MALIKVMSTPRKQHMITVPPQSLNTLALKMEWNWILLFLLSVTEGKGLTSSKYEEEKQCGMALTSTLPFPPQVSTPRFSCSSLDLSW